MMEKADIGFQQRTLERVLQWAATAAPPDAAASRHRKIAADLEADRQRKEAEIQAAEQEIAQMLCRTAYVLLMSIPGVNVVSAAEYAAEMGPIGNYANARCMTVVLRRGWRQRSARQRFPPKRQLEGSHEAPISQRTYRRYRR
jgi:transposase